MVQKKIKIIYLLIKNSKVSTLFITNSVIPPIMQAFRIPYYIKSVLRWRARKLDNKSSLT